MNAEIIDTEIHPSTRKERLASIFTDAIARHAKEIIFHYAEDEFPNVTRAQEVVRHTAKVTYQRVIGCTYAQTSRYISTYVDKQRPRTVVVRVKYDEYRIDKKPKMTNAEKLAKDTNFIATLIVAYDCRGGPRCEYCPLDSCPNCLDMGQTIEWLESEAKEDESN